MAYVVRPIKVRRFIIISKASIVSKVSNIVTFLRFLNIDNELLYLKGSIPGSKNSEILVKKSIKNLKKMTIDEKIKAADQAKKTPDKKKK